MEKCAYWESAEETSEIAQIIPPWRRVKDVLTALAGGP
jgi:hypothetical protein